MEKHLENNNNKNSFYLLDRSYKRFGALLAAFALAGLAWKKITSWAIVLDGDIRNAEKPDASKIVFSIVLVLGLVCIAWAKEKIEDEMIMMFRIRSIVLSFVISILYVIITPLLQLFGGNEAEPISGIYLVTGMLLVYLVSFFLQKKYVS